MSQGLKLKSYKLRTRRQQTVTVDGEAEIVGIVVMAEGFAVLSCVVNPNAPDQDIEIFMIKDGDFMPDVRCELVCLGVYHLGQTRFGIFTPDASAMLRARPYGVAGDGPDKVTQEMDDDD